jgi:excisionase family DNA binding protein
MARHYEILTVKEVCDLLRIHPATVYKLTREGKIPSFRIGSDWRFRKDVIDRWMVEQTMVAPQVKKVIERQ